MPQPQYTDSSAVPSSIALYSSAKRSDARLTRSLASLASTKSKNPIGQSLSYIFYEPSFDQHKPPKTNEPPKREVKQQHHHHHVIPVESEADLENLDEHKVNFLPYNPPVAVSQTNLIQSVGRPFNPNHAKYLPDPGDEFMLSRRASEVRLKHVKIFGDVNPTIVDGLVKSIQLFSILIGVAGFLFFVYVIVVAVLDTPMEYALYFLDTHNFYKMAYMIGVVQPIAVAPYCRYALFNLKHVRTYFLRVPIAQVVPAAVILISLVQFTESVKPTGGMYEFLQTHLSQYYTDSYSAPYARNTWNGIQKTFTCCGCDGYEDWLKYNQPYLPETCCSDLSVNCTQNSTTFYNSGCEGSYRGVNVALSIVFCTFGAAMAILEVLSVVFMRSLYACIGKELYDERSSLKIMCGRLCSICEVENTDDEMEYDVVKDEDSDSGESAAGSQKRESLKARLSNALHGPSNKVAPETGAEAHA